MKVAHVLLGKANPNRMNGVNKVVHALAGTQSEMGMDAEVWGITPTPNDTSEIPERAFRTKLYHSNKHKLWIDAALKEQIKSEKDGLIIHMHGGFIPEYYHLQSYLKSQNVPFIITPHGCYNEKSMENGHRKKHTYFNLFERKLLNNAKYLHCLGKSESQSIDKLAPEVPRVVIPNGQELDDLAYVSEPLERPEVPVLGFCGRMDLKMKGLDLLLKGYHQYKTESSKRAQLWLIGGGYNIEELKRMAAELGIQEDVIFYGPRFGDEKLNLLAHCDAFYHPSRYEGLPMSILEAAGLGLPCVVSDATNMAEYIGEHKAGLILEPNTAASLCASIGEISRMKESGEELKLMSDAAVQMIKNTFSWESIAKRFAEVYAA